MYADMERELRMRGFEPTGKFHVPNGRVGNTLWYKDGLYYVLSESCNPGNPWYLRFLPNFELLVCIVDNQNYMCMDNHLFRREFQ